MKTKFKTRDLTMIAMMGAICCILLHIDFPLPFLPPFMNFDLAGLVEIIGGFAMGPLQAVCIILVKILLKLATEGTSPHLRASCRISCSAVRMCCLPLSCITRKNLKEPQSSVWQSALSSQASLPSLPTCISSFPSIWH